MRSCRAGSATVEPGARGRAAERARAARAAALRGELVCEPAPDMAGGGRLRRALRAIARALAEPAVLRVGVLVESVRVVRLSAVFSGSISSPSWAPFVAPCV
jgi:hypothetical protein